MTKVLKALGILLLIIIIIGAGAFAWISLSDIPSYETTSLSYEATSSPEAIQRGKKLTTMLCAGCHMDRSNGKLVGIEMTDAPPEFGVIYSKNITDDNKYGVGKWTDAELLYLLRTGIKKDGQYAPPYMAKLPHMADEDINAIIAFLRSSDPMVAADATPDKNSEPAFLTKFLCKVAWKPLPMPEKTIPMPDTSDQVALGKYLAYNLECFSCHSADFKTNDYLEPEKSPGYFAGGNKPLNRQGEVVLTANLTPDPETGIGKWSKEQFIQVLRFGTKDGRPLAYPMLPYTQLTDEEAGAIFEYLQTIPAINNKVGS